MKPKSLAVILGHLRIVEPEAEMDIVTLTVLARPTLR